MCKSYTVNLDTVTRTATAPTQLTDIQNISILTTEYFGLPCSEIPLNWWAITREKYYVLQLLQAVEHLHSLGITHGTISPSAISIDPSAGVLKITELRTAQVVGVDVEPHLATHNDDYLRPSTNKYCAAELLTNASPGLSSDIWSIGIVLMEWLTGKPLFDVQRAVDDLFLSSAAGPLHPVITILSNFFRSSIVSNTLNELIFKHPDAHAFLISMLQNSPSARPTAAEAQHHPFFFSALSACEDESDFSAFENQ